jgi:hypothetical protein
VMNYRMTQEFKPPFRVTALIEEAGPSRVCYFVFFLSACKIDISMLVNLYSKSWFMLHRPKLY